MKLVHEVAFSGTYRTTRRNGIPVHSPMDIDVERIMEGLNFTLRGQLELHLAHEEAAVGRSPTKTPSRKTRPKKKKEKKKQKKQEVTHARAHVAG